ncbi:type II toxin-antitoxin system VapC family toxin [Cyanobacterium sp. Dongsha4]|uniref:type II toxin-antitoxin system VapC family toxin n=1 Tax=Cyanobacterium sp. DS4 TaxID=2878255 RepID=UPI002E8041D1|nr:PIN domain-containing protein [Cyanobacterium sp. Dongsha4]WVL02336.1 PIN domain-containing protein [Cyanobacterium sp. Dongsha4]
MIYLDTHVVVWLYGGLIEKLSDTAKSLINQEEIYISPIVRLELQYLYEIERITFSADDILNDLSTRIGLNICQRNFNSIVTQALTINWTRDPFDRLIVAHALIHHDILITKDNNILENYNYAKW